MLPFADEAAYNLRAFFAGRQLLSPKLGQYQLGSGGTLAAGEKPGTGDQVYGS
jgi:hypothetical protein